MPSHTLHEGLQALRDDRASEPLRRHRRLPPRGGVRHAALRLRQGRDDGPVPRAEGRVPAAVPEAPPPLRAQGERERRDRPDPARRGRVSRSRLARRDPHGSEGRVERLRRPLHELVEDARRDREDDRARRRPERGLPRRARAGVGRRREGRPDRAGSPSASTPASTPTRSTTSTRASRSRSSASTSTAATRSRRMRARRSCRGVAIAGIHCHIGSQIADTAGYEKTARKMLAFVKELKEKLGIVLDFVDLGGGIGVPYRDGETVMSPETLASALQPIWKDGVAAAGYEPALWLEPGRSLVAPSGFLITRVNTVKTTPLKTFVNVDAGSNTLLRPALYDAYHRARIVAASADAGSAGAPRLLDVAGDVCETGDILAEGRTLPMPKAGDHVVFLDAGAYGFAMASVYNARPLPAEVLVDGDEAALIRRRGTVRRPVPRRRRLGRRRGGHRRLFRRPGVRRRLEKEAADELDEVRVEETSVLVEDVRRRADDPERVAAPARGHAGQAEPAEDALGLARRRAPAFVRACRARGRRGGEGEEQAHVARRGRRVGDLADAAVCARPGGWGPVSPGGRSARESRCVTNGRVVPDRRAQRPGAPRSRASFRRASRPTARAETTSRSPSPSPSPRRRGRASGASRTPRTSTRARGSAATAPPRTPGSRGRRGRRNPG